MKRILHPSQKWELFTLIKCYAPKETVYTSGKIMKDAGQIQQDPPTQLWLKCFGVYLVWSEIIHNRQDNTSEDLSLNKFHLLDEALLKTDRWQQEKYCRNAEKL